MIVLTQKPFNLNPEDSDWVNKTISEMTIEEKIGQSGASWALTAW